MKSKKIIKKNFWNPAYKGEILMQDSVRDAFMVALSKNGFSVTGEKSERDRQEVDEILRGEFENARKIISEHRPALERAKNFLLEKHTISDTEFTDILNS